MTPKLLKSNGEVIGHITLCHLQQEEYQSKDNKKARSEFNEAVINRLGEPLSDKDVTPDFDFSAVTPEYEVYENDSQSRSLSLIWLQWSI
jgi:hypothetical protein